MTWTEEELPQQVRTFYEKAAWPKDEWPRVFVTRSGLRVLLGREHWKGDPPHQARWHLSISGPNRLATWDEIVSAAHDLRPGVPFCMGVPPRSWWMNVHPHVLHLWQTYDEALLEQWKVNATGQAPT